MSQFISYPDYDKSQVTIIREGDWMDMVEEFQDFLEFVSLDERMNMFVNDMNFYAYICRADNSDHGTHYELI